MKRTRLATLLILAVCVFSEPAIAQKVNDDPEGTYQYLEDGNRLTVTITKGSNDYEVRGDADFNKGRLGQCAIRGTYNPSDGKIQASCREAGRETPIEGYRRKDSGVLELLVEGSVINAKRIGDLSSVPHFINECETYGVYTVCGLWKRDGNQFSAEWKNGGKATLIIEQFDDRQVVINSHRDRMDIRYTGQLSGNKIEHGEFTIKFADGRQGSGTWTASW